MWSELPENTESLCQVCIDFFLYSYFQDPQNFNLTTYSLEIPVRAFHLMVSILACKQE